MSSKPIEVEVVLDEDELFDVPHQSGRRLKIGGGATRAFAPSTAVLDAMALDADDDEVTRVSLNEVRRRLAGRR